MLYYVRKHKNATVEGPFTVNSLAEAIQAGRIPSDALASSDLGEGIADLQVWRRCDWFPLASIEELRDVVVALPEPRWQPRPVSVFTVVCYLGAALGFSYSAVAERRWFSWLLAVLMIFCALDAIIRYARQTENRKPVI